MRIILLLFLASFVTVGCSERQSFPAGQWIDLTHDLSSEAVYWPTAEPFKLETVAAGMTDQGYYYSAYNFCTAEHGGTHIDAPIHFAEGRRSVNEIPLTQLIGSAVKIDVSQKASSNRDYLVSIEDFTNWETQHGRIPDKGIVLLETGFGRHWPDRLRYLGTDKRGVEGVAELHFPGLNPEAAKWLIVSRSISAIGIDTASIDYGQSQKYESHVALMTENIPAFENVASLEKVPPVGAQVIALPIKIKGGSGGPLRIVAFVPD